MNKRQPSVDCGKMQEIYLSQTIMHDFDPSWRHVAELREHAALYIVRQLG